MTVRLPGVTLISTSCIPINQSFCHCISRGWGLLYLQGEMTKEIQIFFAHTGQIEIDDSIET